MIRLRIGAPVYRHQLNAHHGASLVELAQLASEHDVQIIGPHYEHTSLLPAGRRKILESAMVTSPEERAGGVPDADFLYSCDADTWIDAPDLLALIGTLAFRPTEWALCGVLVPQDDGGVNAWEDHGVKLTRVAEGWIGPVWAIGAAATIHNLHWYRAVRDRWGDRAAMVPTVSYGVVPANAPGAYIGEDVFHCRWVAEEGGIVLGARLRSGVVHHAAFGVPRPQIARAR